MKNNIKKSLTIGTIIGLSLCALMLILTIFGISFFDGIKLKILITCACFTVGGYFSISSYSALNRNKPLGIVSFCLIWMSVVLILISAWFSTSSVFGDITLTIALLSVLFNFIVSNMLKLGKHYLIIQIICNIIIGLLILFILLLAYGVMKFKSIVTLFWLLIVLSVVSFILMSVLSSKFRTDDKTEQNFVKIPKSDYDELLKKAKQLDDILASKDKK